MMANTAGLDWGKTVRWAEGNLCPAGRFFLSIPCIHFFQEVYDDS